MDVEKLLKGQGGYVFVSHSHLDITDVREIRNFLEQKGMEPILFYLRCMDDGDEGKLGTLKQLIFDEIDARDFFLYINSKNAAASKWVQEELAHIQSTRPYCLARIDLDGDDKTLKETLERLVRGMRVFLCASRADHELIERIGAALQAHDFRVYDASDALAANGDAWDTQLTHTFKELADEGFVIALTTKSSIRSPFFKTELDFAVSQGIPILPVIVGDSTFAFSLCEQVPGLRRLQLEMLSETPSDEEIEHLVRSAMAMRESLL